jgi:hypothetical protein
MVVYWSCDVKNLILTSSMPWNVQNVSYLRERGSSREYSGCRNVREDFHDSRHLLRSDSAIKLYVIVEMVFDDVITLASLLFKSREIENAD